MEFCSSRFTHQAQEGLSIAAVRVAVYGENFASMVSRVYAYLQAQGPLAIGCTIHRVQGHSLYKGNDSWDPYTHITWSEQSMDLGFKVSYDFSNERLTITKSINDLLGNAFHLDKCPYDDTGEFVRPAGN